MSTAAPTSSALLDCLLQLRPRVSVDDQQLIDATIAGNKDAALRARIGPVSLTPTRWAVLVTIDAWWREHGHAPTLEEIGRTHGVSKVTAFEHVKALVKLGVVAIDRHKARTLRIVERKVGG